MIHPGDPQNESDLRIAIVAARFNASLTEMLLKNTLAGLATCNVTENQIEVFWVPGAFEIPVVAKHLGTGGLFDVVICLGVILKGETDHDQLVAHQSVRALVDLSLSLNKPIGFGIIGPNATHEQGLLRAEQYASHAVDTVLALIALL